MTTIATSLAADWRAFDFQNLFVPGLGWNYYRGQLVVSGVAGATVRALWAENPEPERVTILAMATRA